MKMYYTMVYMEEVYSKQYIQIDSSGRKYLVWLGRKCEDGEGESCRREFDSIKEAYAAYERIARCFAFGKHNFETRKAMLMGEHEVAA